MLLQQCVYVAVEVFITDTVGTQATVIGGSAFTSRLDVGCLGRTVPIRSL